MRIGAATDRPAEQAQARPVFRWPDLLADRRFWLTVALVVTASLYLSTLQWGINGSTDPYCTDVGEIQNALPRWGTIHYPGYPLYTLLGSASVSLLRLVGIAPAAGASLFSAAWGLVTTAIVFVLAGELGAGPALSALGAIAASLATSMWVDASLAEIHTMGAALTAATLLFALRFGRSGRERDLLCLATAFSVGIVHQRTTLFLAPAVLVLIWGRWAELWRQAAKVLGIGALSLATYLYLPIRAWMGARWTFGAVGTWQGFLQIFLDTKVDRVVALPTDLAGWFVRARTLVGLLNNDLWLPALLLGLVGLCLLPPRRGARREAIALALAWLPALLLSLVIWEGRVSDALLAAKLPMTLLAGVGLALLAQAMARLTPRVALLGAVALVAVVAGEAYAHRPAILAVTRDPSAERTIDRAMQVAQPGAATPTTFVAPWGHTYWALAYAQAYRGQLAGLNIVDHNADMAAIAARGDRLLTFSETLYVLPLTWWDARLGHAYLSLPEPGIVEISPQPATASAVPPGPGLDLQNGVRILSAGLRPVGERQWVLTVYWQAERTPEADYSVAVHLLAHDPPRGSADILAQADRQHPVDGWYPTSRWAAGEVVRDTYEVAAPPDSKPQALRVGMYRVLPGGGFENSPWLTLPL